MVSRPATTRGFAVCLLAPLLGLLCVSCSGSGLVAVRGKVLHQGNPVEGAVVTFHPKAGGTELPSSGLTDKDGNFTLSTGTAAGAPPGEYVVTINWHKPVDPPGGKKKMSTESPPPPPDVFQGKPYAARDKSPLTATITGATTELEPFRIE